MSDTFARIQELVGLGDIRISEHGYDELAADNLFARDIIGGISDAVLVEDYPTFPKGPCVLLLQQDRRGRPVHVVWGIARNTSSPAVLVTAYRPDPERWSNGFTKRTT